jgi:hypothetical protein
MKSFLTLLFASSIVLTSCKKETEAQNSATPTNVVPFTEVGNQMKNEAIANQAQQPTNKVNSTNVMPTTTATVADGKNPAHGQPSHRCDIPVGAPLNSPPATTTPKPAVQQQQTQSITVPTVVPAAPAVATTPTPEGMNPPHGQTNHRCDIAVGAPLPKS